MSNIDTTDLTGQPPTAANVEEAMRVVRKYRSNTRFVVLNPELGVELGNIERCLAVAAAALRRPK